MSDRGKQGFGSMDPDKQRRIASNGGRIAHERGRAHVWTPEEARVAGRKGGLAVSADRAHMAAIGRLGAQRRPRPVKETSAEAPVEAQDS